MIGMITLPLLWRICIILYVCVFVLSECFIFVYWFAPSLTLQFWPQQNFLKLRIPYDIARYQRLSYQFMIIHQLLKRL